MRSKSSTYDRKLSSASLMWYCRFEKDLKKSLFNAAPDVLNASDSSLPSELWNLLGLQPSSKLAACPLCL